MEDRETHVQRRIPLLLVLLTPVVLSVLYGMAWGPALFLIVRCNVDFDKAHVIGFYPHLWLMSRSKAYFTYATWWVRLGGHTADDESHEAFQRVFQRMQASLNEGP